MKPEKFRKVLALPEVLENVDLTNKLKEIYEDYLALLEEHKELKNKARAMDDIAEIKRTAKIYSGYYTLNGVKYENGEDVCFCLNCLYEHKLQIPMAFGVVERGVMDLMSGETFVPNTYGLSCHKCGAKLAINKKEKNNG